ncbi:DNA helicase RecQ [Ferruginivarius sediminum]|uniref:DNA helicase RecQ n=1 Tax=Ferruginivarius sediminum TaxID=2661937 RepID=A0A369TC64_9PROT|nr:DNA helicase RecQ [Ferruginivarius sediminum]RDD62868.1 DNA helicase RecQ [Ferruginivarius sediminum]
MPEAATPLASDTRSVLKTVFGHADFRPGQGEIVDHVVAGGDALVLMPTGGGKSICYQVPALVRPGLAVVVSPLIALMQDQVAQLRQMGVPAAALTSSLEPEAARDVRRAIDAGELDLLYVSPERLTAGSLLDQLARVPLALFAIDEAHCVSQWGHDFRPEYRRLPMLAERFPQVPRVVLTATADAVTRRDIRAQLCLEGAREFVASFDRPNIRYRVQVKTSANRQLLDFIKRSHAGESGIVYCMSRKRVEEVAEMLRREGIKALGYHAGMPAEERADRHHRFVNEDGLVMVATIAFGMGIDKPDVRFVAHLDMPKTFEAYYQETGRAGRDSLPAEALMLYGLQDVARLRRLVESSDAPDDIKRLEQRKLESLLGYCETARCRRQVLLEYFGETSEACGNCDTCLTPVETEDGTHEARLLLSAIYRCGQSFGAGHIVDVLTGKETEKVTRRGHDTLGVFGAGKHLPAKRWQGIVRQLAAAGLVVVDVENHGVLRLADRERVVPVLRGEAGVTLRKEPEGGGRRRGRAETRATLQSLSPEQEQLFQKLRGKRAELAGAQGVPPYVVFTDATLIELVRQRPRNRDAFAAIPGVGRSKLDRYADIFLTALSEE